MSVHIIDPRRRDEHVRQLRSVGIDTAAVQRVGQFDLREWADAHLRGGYFDQARTRALFADIRGRSKQDGLPHDRTEIALGPESLRPSSARLLEASARHALNITCGKSSSS